MISLLAESYFHTLDPFAIQFTSTFGLRWYGLAYAAGFLIAWLMLCWFAKTNRSPLTMPMLGDLLFYVIAGVLVGGRIGYALFYDQQLFIGFSSTFPFWDLLAINKGGMASHGGMIGVIAACIIFGRRRNISSLHLLDMGALICSPGLFLGRLANFVNGELLGRALPPADQVDPPGWSMKFPQEMHEWVAGPAEMWETAKLERVGEIVTQSLNLTTFEWNHFLSNAAADPAAREHVRNIIDRLILLTQDGNQQVIDGLRPLLTAFYPSQLLQALTDGPILFGALALIWLKPRKPGVIGGWFLIIYGLLRIATEQFRQPDEGVALWMGLSRGQQLSAIMIASGIVGLIIVARRNVERMGGLLRPAPRTGR